MERHWNVLKFTCGLMEDSSLLIERICQAFVEIATRPKPRQSFCQLYGCLYLKDLDREKSAISRSPFNNPHLCYNNQTYFAAIYAENSNYELYYFNGWDKGESTDEKWEQTPESKGTNQVEHLKPCSVVIHQGLFTAMETYLWMINLLIKQPIKNLLIFGGNSQRSDCDDICVRQGSPSEPFLPSFGFRNTSEPFQASFGIRNQNQNQQWITREGESIPYLVL